MAQPMDCRNANAPTSRMENADHNTHRLRLAIIVALVFLVQGAMRMLPQLYLKEQGVSTIVISLATTLLWLGILVGSAFWGELCDRVSKRSVLVGALASGFLSLGVLAFLLPPVLFLVACFFHALLAIGVVPATMSMVSSRSHVSQRGRDLSNIGFSRSLGMAAGGILAGVLLAATGFRWAFLLLGCTLLLGLLFVFPPQRQQKHDVPLKRTAFSFLGVGRLRGIYLGVTLSQMGLLGSASLVFVHMSNIGITEGIMGVLAALAPATAMLTMLLSGAWPITSVAGRSSSQASVSLC